jgi:hypothetical protein
MYTLSNRTLAAMAFDRGEEYDPGLPPAGDLLDFLSLAQQAVPIITDIAPQERRRRRERESRHAHVTVPEWFSPEDLICRPWELVHHEPV